MSINTTVKRFTHIDIYKAIGIILMMVGHVDFSRTFTNWFGAFNMAMFFFISGYLFKDNGVKNFIIRKSKSLLIPYFIWGGINAIACTLIVNHFKLGRYLERLFWFNNDPALPITGALWFLTCLFFVNIIFYFLKKYCKKYILEFVIIFLVVLEFVFKIRLPWSLDSAIFMLPVFYAGLKFKQQEANFNSKTSLILSLIISIITFFTIKANVYVNVRTNTYSDLFLFYFNALSMSIALYFISIELAKIKSINFVKQIGEKSLDYMCSHQIILKLLQTNGFESKWIIFGLILIIVNIFIFIKDFCKKLLVKKITV